MTSIYLALIFVPLVFMVTLQFIFSGSIQQVTNEQFLANCPYPINAGIATINDIDNNNRLNYTITYDNATSDYHLTLFECSIDNITGQPTANTIVFTESATNWFGVGTGYLAYISNSITIFFQNSYHWLTMIWLMYDSPAQVSGLSFFTYINLFFTACIVTGGIMIARGIGN